MKRFPPLAALVCALLFVAVPAFAQGGAASAIVGKLAST